MTTGESSNGRTAGFEPAYAGSSPASPATAPLTDAKLSPEELASILTIYQPHTKEHRMASELKALRDHGGIEFLFKWMRTPNPMLGNISPEQMIKLGRGHTLIQFIHDAQEDFEAMEKQS